MGILGGTGILPVILGRLASRPYSLTILRAAPIIIGFGIKLSRIAISIMVILKTVIGTQSRSYVASDLALYLSAASDNTGASESSVIFINFLTPSA